MKKEVERKSKNGHLNERERRKSTQGQKMTANGDVDSTELDQFKKKRKPRLLGMLMQEQFQKLGYKIHRQQNCLDHVTFELKRRLISLESFLLNLSS
jgi:hypothetical protein